MVFWPLDAQGGLSDPGPAERCIWCNVRQRCISGSSRKTLWSEIQRRVLQSSSGWDAPSRIVVRLSRHFNLKSWLSDLGVVLKLWIVRHHAALVRQRAVNWRESFLKMYLWFIQVLVKTITHWNYVHELRHPITGGCGLSHKMWKAWCRGLKSEIEPH